MIVSCIEFYNILLKGEFEMSVFIGIEDLAANALILLFKRKGINFVSFEELTKYGAKVVEILNKKGEKATLIYSKDITNALERNYSNYFETFIREQKQYIKLKDSVTVEDVIKKYRSYLSIDMLFAYTCKESIEVLGA